EASDGTDAVRQARALSPELVLLDVSLPSLSGIEAAKRILAHNPDARILFLSEHRSPDIVEAALGTGPCGYVLKSSSGTELLPAMEAAVGGGRFISATLARLAV